MTEAQQAFMAFERIWSLNQSDGLNYSNYLFEFSNNLKSNVVDIMENSATT